MDNDGTSMSQIYIGIFYSRGTSFFRVVNRNSLLLGLLHFRKYYTLAKSKGCCPKKARKAHTKLSDSTLSNKQTKEPISHRKLTVKATSMGAASPLFLLPDTHAVFDPSAPLAWTRSSLCRTFPFSRGKRL